MANKWVYRRDNLPWYHHQTSNLRRRSANQGTTAISGVLETPIRMDAAYQQRWMRGRRRLRNGAYAANALARPTVILVGPQVFNQAVDGTIAAAQLVGTLDHLTNKNPAGALTPAGALDVSVSYPLTGAITPAGVVTQLTSRTFTPAALVPAGGIGKLVAKVFP